MGLYAETSGAGLGRTLVLVHGFTQTRACWGSFADDLAADREVVRVDAPGHGRSGHGQADLWQAADLLATTAGRADYVGYSMGGRICLHLALADPETVQRLVLIGASAGITDRVERAARLEADRERALHIEQVGVETFLTEWLDGPLFAHLDDEAACRDARLENTSSGLAASLRSAGAGAQEPLWERLGGIRMPILLLAGAHDDKYAVLAERMATQIGPNATVALVDGAGHAAHLEQPSGAAAIVRRWLNGV